MPPVEEEGARGVGDAVGGEEGPEGGHGACRLFGKADVERHHDAVARAQAAQETGLEVFAVVVLAAVDAAVGVAAVGRLESQFVLWHAAFARAAEMEVVGAAQRGLVPAFDEGEDADGVDLAGTAAVVLERAVVDEVRMDGSVGLLRPQRGEEEELR